MPFFMDRHEFNGATADELAAAHVQDVGAQGEYGVEYVTYWFDYERQHAFCLARGPSADAVEAVHRVAHGNLANQVIEVDEPAVARFMGGIARHATGEAYVETAFRAILFTDLQGSTSLTQQIGDARAMAVLRRHDEIVRSALARTGGAEVKHTGDGMMASFRSAASAIEAAVMMQLAFVEAEAGGQLPLAVRIGIAAGEPVEERNDLFGAAVQLAARLCSRAEPRSIMVSSAVRDLATGKGFRFESPTTLRLKGFDESVRASQVVWRDEQ